MARECGAGELHVSADCSAYATARERRLAAACEEERIAFRAHPGVTIVPPGAVTPAGGDHFKVFTPYHRAWSEVPLRQRARRAAASLRSRLGLAGRSPAGPGLADRAARPRHGARRAARRRAGG